MRLKDKVALISGVGKRFGKAAAFIFAKEGAKVIIISRTCDVINDIKKSIDVLAYTCDVTKDKEIKSVLINIIEKHKKIDILFNNVGGFYSKKEKCETFDENYFMQVLENNLKSSFLMAKNVIPLMKSNNGGSIINVSAAYKTRQDGNIAYSTSKMGIIGFTKNLAREYADDNIRVNMVMPGVIRINADQKHLEKYPKELRRPGLSEDVAQAALFFASDDSSWITGQNLVIDGGEELFIDSILPVR